MQTKGALALVTGASQRIGRAIAIALADVGADVIIHCNNSVTAAEATAESCRQRGAKAYVITADLSNADDVIGLWKSAIQQTGAPPTILINNASYYKRETFDRATTASWDAAMAVNLRAPFILTQLMARELAKIGSGGCVINMNDRRVTYRTRWTYGVTVGALSALTAAIAQAVPAYIRVNELRLGPVLPPGDHAVADATNTVLSQPLLPLDEVTNAILDIIRDDSASGRSIELSP